MHKQPVAGRGTSVVTQLVIVVVLIATVAWQRQVLSSGDPPLSDSVAGKTSLPVSVLEERPSLTISEAGADLSVREIPASAQDPSNDGQPATRSVTGGEKASVQQGLIEHGDRSVPLVALTFDACQTQGRPSGYDETVIKILTDTQTPATLFLGGLWVRSHPNQMRDLAANPLLEFGNHSWSHPDFRQLSPDEMRREILRTQDIVTELTGRKPRLFRFPYNVHSPESLAAVNELGLLAVGCDVITGDPDPRVSAGDIILTVDQDVQNGSIVIMHMNQPDKHTAEALPELIEQLRASGFRFVTVSQLLEIAWE